MGRRFVIACLGLLLTVSCTGGNVSTSQITVDGSPGPPTSVASPTPTYSPAPDACPKNLSTRVRRNQVHGQERTLVPDTPVTLVVCLGDRRVAVTNEKTVVWFTDELNGLKEVPPGETFACPFDLGPTYGLFFGYANHDVLLVTVSSSGCRFASNAHVTAQLGDSPIVKRTQLLLAPKA
jgi:hypothetical protein